ncbi:hypothetical protein CI109_104276 [Kwoniella shandongensis]|uniref:Uncharacterized protein n=1 Tax=Kwoniella shandongensis TaxID=1734106 RepID=A0AAJ8MYA2_9TREE
MIRSNPTAIPLRASDVKSLQIEIDKRKAERERHEANPVQATPEGGNQASKQAGGEKVMEGSMSGHLGKEKRSVAERIGI